MYMYIYTHMFICKHINIHISKYIKKATPSVVPFKLQIYVN
jgi:hypothetical protein